MHQSVICITPQHVNFKRIRRQRSVFRRTHFVPNWWWNSHTVDLYLLVNYTMFLWEPRNFCFLFEKTFIFQCCACFSKIAPCFSTTLRLLPPCSPCLCFRWLPPSASPLAFVFHRYASIPRFPPVFAGFVRISNFSMFCLTAMPHSHPFTWCVFFQIFPTDTRVPCVCLRAVHSHPQCLHVFQCCPQIPNLKHSKATAWTCKQAPTSRKYQAPTRQHGSCIAIKQTCPTCTLKCASIPSSRRAKPDN